MFVNPVNAGGELSWEGSVRDDLYGTIRALEMERVGVLYRERRGELSVIEFYA